MWTPCCVKALGYNFIGGVFLFILTGEKHHKSPSHHMATNKEPPQIHSFPRSRGLSHHLRRPKVPLISILVMDPINAVVKPTRADQFSSMKN